jgi:5-methylcytosine-specific restriction endonuclease McrA
MFARLGNHHPPNYAKRVIAKARGNACAQCGARKGRSIIWLHLDHVVPLADGGAFTINNMQLLCADCQGAKNEPREL